MAAPSVDLTIDPRLKRPIFRNARWNPVEWKPIYEMIVAAHAAGKSNTAIAEHFNFTPQHISNILNCVQGKKFLKAISENLRKTTLQTLPKRLERLTEAALEIAEHVLITDKDIHLENTPFKLLDRSLTVLKGVGKLSGDAPTNVQNNTIIISKTHEKQLTDGMANLQKVWQLHGGPAKEIVKALEGADSEVATEE